MCIISIKKKIAELESQPIKNTEEVDFLKGKLLLLSLLDREIERFTHSEYKRLKKEEGLLPSQATKQMRRNREPIGRRWDEVVKEIAPLLN
jgi:hypothetical protein